MTSKMGVTLLLTITSVSLSFIALIVLLERKSNQSLDEEYRKIRASEERLNLALGNTSLTVWDFDLQTHSIIQTERSMQWHGFARVITDVPESLIACGYVHADSVADLRELYQKLDRGETHAEGVFRVQTFDRSGWWYERIQYSTLFNEKGQPYLAIGLSQDVTETQLLSHAAQTDSLTGLFNHATAIDSIKHLLNSSDCSACCALFIVDLDYFKQINDTLGHQVGDDTLQTAAHIMKHIFRREDVIGRIGGDEFIVFLKDLPNISLVRYKAQQLVQLLQLDCKSGDSLVKLSCSIGVALYQNGEPFDALYKRADEALYQAKRNGRNCYYTSDSEQRC